ncbi:MAG: hypothetical protein EOP19_32420, partial [Hyphomicrobiales bacterium]
MAAFVVGAAVAGFATSASAQGVPAGYPADYAATIEASKAEKGLVIYSNMADNNWQPVIAGFKAAYPWINIETLDLGSGTVHSRWEAEAGSGSRTADVLISGANDRWANYGAGDKDVGGARAAAGLGLP